MIAKGEVSGKLAKEIFPKMFATGDAPAAIMEREGLKQISDTGALESVIEEVIAKNPKQVEQFRGGQDHGHQLPGRPGDEGHARAGRRDGDQEMLKRKLGGGEDAEGGRQAPDIPGLRSCGASGWCCTSTLRPIRRAARWSPASFATT